MSRPFFILVMDKTNLAKDEIDRRVTNVESFYKELVQGAEKNSSHSQHIHMYSWGNIKRDTDKIRLVFSNSKKHCVATHFPFGLGMRHKTQSAISGEWISDAIATQNINLTPPEVLVEHDIAADRAIVLTDTFGFGKVYFSENNQLAVWTNRPGVVPIIMGSMNQKSFAGWSSYANLGWFMDEHTSLEGVRQLTALLRITISGVRQNFETKNIPSEMIWKTDIDLTPEKTEEVAHDLLEYFKEIEFLTDQTLRIGLSGGRDSRVMAAFALKSGMDAVFKTLYPPNLEVEIAEQLMTNLPSNVRWEKVHNTGSQGLTTKLSDRLDAWFKYYDGDFRPEVIHKNFECNFDRPLSISGAGGEFAHPNFRDKMPIPTSLQGPVLRWMINDFIFGFFVKSKTAHMQTSRKASRQLSQIAKNVFRQGYEKGIRGGYLSDWFYIQGKFRRWAGGTRDNHLLLPFMTPKYLQAGFSLHQEEKRNSKLHRELIKLCVPKWADIPFYHEAKKNRKKEDVTNNLVRPYIWTGTTRAEFMDLLQTYKPDGIYNSQKIFEHFQKLDDKKTKENSENQNMANRILWNIGFDRWASSLKKHIK